MSTIDAIILGIIQGATEFLPVSSSGHLILARSVFHISDDGGLVFDVLLHLATALAILVYFRLDIINVVQGVVRNDRRSVRFMILILIAIIPAGLAGYFLEHTIETYFRSPILVAVMLCVGSVIFFLAEKKHTKDTYVATIPSTRTALSIGFWQVLALLPGTSRSGITISGGMLGGLSRTGAARFSFLMGFPLVVAAGIKGLFELDDAGPYNIMPLIFGCVAALVVGLLTITALMRLFETHSLKPFIYYRIILAMLILMSLI